MKKLNKFILTAAFVLVANLTFAQQPVKQYCGGTNGSVSSPSNALGGDLSNCSTLKLRTPNAKKDNVYQSFVFSPEATRGTRVAFVIQTDSSFDANKVIELNFKFFTSVAGVASDTLAYEEVHITPVNSALNLYEFSFVSAKDFDTAGILLQGGGIFKTAKIYKVYLAINQTKVAPFRFVSSKNN